MTLGIVLLVLLGLLIVVAIAVIGIYNVLVRLRNQVKNAWSQIDVQLKRRHDLIPNLIETAKGYMTHERETLENITKARNLATQASGVTDQGQAEGNLNRALGQFFLVVENLKCSLATWRSVRPFWTRATPPKPKRKSPGAAPSAASGWPSG